MTKRDFQAIAAALYGCRAPREDQWEVIVDALADVLAASNPRFDRARFVEACETGKCKGMRQVRP